MSRLHTPRAGPWVRLYVAIIYPLVGAVFRIRWYHLERVPPPSAGAVVVAANHVSQIDPLLIARCVWQSGRVPRFMIKSGVFRWPVLGPWMRRAGQIPVVRGGADAVVALGAAVQALQRGEAVVIYPEGTTTRAPDNWPMSGRTGIARLVLLFPDVPVIPIGQWGAQRTGPSLRRLGRRRLAQASVGRPVDLARFRGRLDSAVLREITDVIMTAVRDEVAALRGEQPPVPFFVPTRRYVDRR